MIHMEEKHNSDQNNQTDDQTPLTSVQQYTGLGLDRQRARGQIRSHAGPQVRGLSLGGLMCETLRGERGGIPKDERIDGKPVSRGIGRRTALCGSAWAI